MKPLVAALCALTMASVSLPAFAHHNANAEWQMDKEVPLTGVLKQVRDISPHAIWIVEVKNPKGEVETWILEAVSSNALRRQGVEVKKDIRPGDTYTFFIAPAREDGKKGGFLKGITIAGKKIQIVRA